MPPEQTRTTGKGARGKPRRAVVRVRGKTVRERLRDLAEHPATGWGLTIGLVFTVAMTALAVWSRSHPVVAVGQVMDRTRTVRVKFSTFDEAETERAREAERQRTPRVYVRDRAAFEDIRTSLSNLPASLAGVATLEEVDRGIRERFGLNDEELAALRAVTDDPAAIEQWQASVTTLMDILGRRPILDGKTYQAATQEGLNERIELRGDADPEQVAKRASINADDAAQLATEVEKIVHIAGFAAPVDGVVEARLTRSARPTYQFDAELTRAAQDAAASVVSPVRREYAVGQRIFDRGDVLDESQLALHRRELAEFTAQAPAWRIWTQRVALFLTIGGLTVILGGYLVTFNRRISRRSARLGWIATLVGMGVAIACVVTVTDPWFGMFAVPGSVVLVAVLMRIAYDRRTAAVIAMVGAVLICLALDRSVGVFTLCLAGIAAACGALGEVRDRREIIRMSFGTAAVLAIGAIVVGLVERPLAPTAVAAARNQTLSEALLAGLGGLVVGGVTLFVLPFIERVFDITTGMTLIELRDPKQPLLREMQLRAPGTYNHSLNVASIAEAAAEAIGADSLLTYVGCLYHDIGKINKPEYFIENQRRGVNRHDKLSPAMSLLVIVGHVKDGVEMAREHGIPRPIIHFIEAHHGTTLVEFFYRRAQERAKVDEEGGKAGESDAERLPQEVDYRYPGPKPQTKEVAITMLADAVESATRTLAEPTPSRIDTLVRQLAQARLSDGQFDECELTLREVRTICDSISKTVASIYHGRIKYASDEPKREAGEPGETRAEKSA
ncbi:MAG: HDIG domain-containing protein [Phycisphaerales bacterium]